MDWPFSEPPDLATIVDADLLAGKAWVCVAYQAARLFGVTQPRVSDLMRGKVDLFSLDTLVNMLTAYDGPHKLDRQLS